MTDIGTVIDGKYEILKEISRGGMSIVYLAMDKRLNKQWAVKEIRKRGNGKNDEVVVNSLLAEANMMKRLDHPSLPRIVDIIDNGITIYVVMDYIEGESLDKILNEYGAQPEELVVGWAKQLCDALSYLHSQKPSIIYRDMKPANVMLKPEGNIKIIDFGIAREYKEQNLADTTVLGTKGYAPPEQYSGQTDPRSDIFALGMTMHHLLTGVDPRSGEAYAPVRSWNPELSEGIEIIIDRCVEPAAENRYQNCADLLYDLEHPELITKGYKKKQKIRLAAFMVSVCLCVVLAVAGVVFNLTATHVNNQDYDINLASSNPDNYSSAIAIYPNKVDAYNKLIEYYQQAPSNDGIKKTGIAIENNAHHLDLDDSEIADMHYDMGKLFISEYDDTFKFRAINAKPFFEKACDSVGDFDKKTIAKCYYSICNLITENGTTTEPSADDYYSIFNQIDNALEIVNDSSDREANYDKFTLYSAVITFLHSQADYLPGANVNREDVIDRMEAVKYYSDSITPRNKEAIKLQERINVEYDRFLDDIQGKYNEAEKRQQGGN